MAQIRKRITLNVDETRAFALESHEGGGYLWAIVSNDESLTQVQLKPQLPTRDDVPQPLGKSVPVLVEIKALSMGKSAVVLEEKRPWEKDGKPLNICGISITIK